MCLFAMWALGKGCYECLTFSHQFIDSTHSLSHKAQPTREATWMDGSELD